MATVSLPRSLDVVVNITRASAETATDMSVGCLMTDNTSPYSSGEIVRYYSDLTSLAVNWPAATHPEVHSAASVFFSQSPRLSQLVVGLYKAAKASGRITFTAQPTAADTVTVATTTYIFKSTMAQANDVKIGTDLAATMANLKMAIHGTGVAGTNYYAGTSAVTTVAVEIVAAVVSPAADAYAQITAKAYGVAGEAIALAESGTSTAISGALLACSTSVADAATAIQEVAVASGTKIFAWAMDKTLGADVVANQQALAAWCLANYLACFLCSYSTNAHDSSSTTDIGYLLKNSSNTATTVFWHETTTEYPEMAAMAIMLSVDYAGVDTVKTLKFKTAVGITASNIDTTRYNALNAKNYNMVAKSGNVAILTREGKNAASSWFTDDYIGIQNFREEIQVAVFNVFIAKKKVPYTLAGQTMLKSACDTICRRYVNNGFLAPRATVDEEGADVIIPAYSVVPGNIALASASDRALRVGPPIAITAYLSGAIHKVTLNVDMIQ